MEEMLSEVRNSAEVPRDRLRESAVLELEK